MKASRFTQQFFYGILLSMIVFLIDLPSNAQYSVTRVEPTSWWVGMHNPELQLMVYGPGISELKPSVEYPGVTLGEVTYVSNPNYLFLMIHIDHHAKPGQFNIQFSKEKEALCAYPFALWQREENSSMRQGFDPSDVIYLITPDRFANGDPSNDNVDGYDEVADRSDKDGRHGGDLAGITAHLDYLEDMGFTTIWLNPVLENNMPRTSYHGYAITDFYKVDPRYGSNEQYRELSRLAKAKGIKLIMDMVENHCGLEHWWMRDLPSNNWINNGGRYSPTNHRRSTIQDPYVSPVDKYMFPNGWFVTAMPDMNQRNPLMARYLIQNTIWWIEYAGLSGIRQDTYSYPDKDFMADWSCAVMEEYPNFSIVGEEWSTNPAIVSYWQRGKLNKDGYTSCLPSLMDFPLQSALVQGLTDGEEIYNEGLIKMYEMLANDFLYADPYHMVIFPDNHDMSRFFTQVNEDLNLYKMGIAYILTMRGIPQIFYGTEILMTNPGTTDHGVIRSDFPGGWDGDMVDAFTGSGLSEKQLAAREYMKTLLRWRKEKKVIHEGDLMHFNPLDGTYVYFRYDPSEMIMVIINKNYDDYLFPKKQYADLIADKNIGKDILSGKEYSLQNFVLPARSVFILEIYQ